MRNLKARLLSLLKSQLGTTSREFWPRLQLFAHRELFEIAERAVRQLPDAPVLASLLHFSTSKLWETQTHQHQWHRRAVRGAVDPCPRLGGFFFQRHRHSGEQHFGSTIRSTNFRSLLIQRSGPRRRGHAPTRALTGVTGVLPPRFVSKRLSTHEAAELIPTREDFLALA